MKSCARRILRPDHARERQGVHVERCDRDGTRGRVAFECVWHDSGQDVLLSEHQRPISCQGCRSRGGSRRRSRVLDLVTSAVRRRDHRRRRCCLYALISVHAGDEWSADLIEKGPKSGGDETLRALPEREYELTAFE